MGLIVGLSALSFITGGLYGRALGARCKRSKNQDDASLDRIFGVVLRIASTAF